MKRLIAILLLLATAAGMSAQSDSTRRMQLLPDSVFYADTAMNADTVYLNDSVSVYEEEGIQAPNRNPLLYFGSPFCDHFCDLKFVAGRGEFAVGLDYSYLPEVWGVRVGGYVGKTNLWLLPGVNYRLSKPWTSRDWQVYGGVGVCGVDRRFQEVRPAAEIGIRMASANGWGRWCSTSGTLGVLTNFDGVFVTFGFGLEISVLALSFVLLAL